MDILTTEDETTMQSQSFRHQSPSDRIPHPRQRETSTAPIKKSKTSQNLESVCYLTATGCHLLS